MRDEYIAVTRFADLDTQRHVTSRTYESFALEGRFRLLKKLGYDHEQIYLNPVMGYVKFHRQQFPGTELKVVSNVNLLPQAAGLHWNQKIYQMDGELVCHLQLQTMPTVEIKGIDAEPDEAILYDSLKPWSGASERVICQYQMPYADRDFAGKYNIQSLWKIFEEGRWMFVERIGLTYEKIVELDTTSFFMGSICNFFSDVPAGRQLQVMTWIERIDKIRYWFRQDVMYNGKLLVSMRDEQLIVSLSRQRPQRASEQFLKYIGKYVEYP